MSALGAEPVARGAYWTADLTASTGGEHLYSTLGWGALRASWLPSG
jgi:hypothetical protein